jgi:hypothetical protein
MQGSLSQPTFDEKNILVPGSRWGGFDFRRACASEAAGSPGVGIGIGIDGRESMSIPIAIPIPICFRQIANCCHRAGQGGPFLEDSFLRQCAFRGSEMDRE